MRIFFIFINFFFLIISKAYSDITKKIINNLEKSNNYSFKFIKKLTKKRNWKLYFSI